MTGEYASEQWSHVARWLQRMRVQTIIGQPEAFSHSLDPSYKTISGQLPFPVEWCVCARGVCMCVGDWSSACARQNAKSSSGAIPDANVPEPAPAAPTADPMQSVRETLRRADAALKKANQPLPSNGVILPAGNACECVILLSAHVWVCLHEHCRTSRILTDVSAAIASESRYMERSPAPDDSFGGFSNVLGDISGASPTFRPSMTPPLRCVRSQTNHLCALILCIHPRCIIHMEKIL